MKNWQQERIEYRVAEWDTPLVFQRIKIPRDAAEGVYRVKLAYESRGWVISTSTKKYGVVAPEGLHKGYPPSFRNQMGANNSARWARGTWNHLAFVKRATGAELLSRYVHSMSPPVVGVPALGSGVKIAYQRL